jgi:formamidopyrimidine-DNA glycosylase
MPELPEVQTTVDGINETVKGLTILDVWTDMFSVSQLFSTSIKNKSYFEKVFRPAILGKKIQNTSRRAKNILIQLEKDITILIHMKMTGHMMYGTYEYNKKKNTWSPSAGQENLLDPFNRFIHVVFSLNNGKHLVLCDMRKFAKVTLLDEETKKELNTLGPEPLDKAFDKKVFIEKISRFPNLAIKTALLNQTIVSGIGNIYSDEILHTAKVLPYRKVSELSIQELQIIHAHIAPILRSGIDMGGDSMSDYRNIYGERGSFQGKHKVYRRTGLTCTRTRCVGVIERMVIMGRSAHFCRGCQV